MTTKSLPVLEPLMIYLIKILNDLYSVDGGVKLLQKQNRAPAICYLFLFIYFRLSFSLFILIH